MEGGPRRARSPPRPPRPPPGPASSRRACRPSPPARPAPPDSRSQSPLDLGEQLVYNTATTPKPLASVLAAIVSPLPPTRAWALVVGLALGVLVASLLAAGSREAGTLGGVAAVGAFVVAAPLDRVLWTSLVDAVTAALVVLAIALRGRARIASLVLAGLLRPEAWVLSALAGYVESAGSRLRRLLLGIGAGVLPLLLWTAFDLAVTGDPRASRRFQETGELLSQSPREALGLFRA